MSKRIKTYGKQYWRSLDQLAGTNETRSFLENEFPEGTLDLSDGVSRRRFLSLMGASLALAGLAGCRRPIEKIIPYVTAPEDIIPGIPIHYASAMPVGLETYGILVENHEGRPTKLDGNRLHPESLGKANTFVQAAILDLYDPDRAKDVRHLQEAVDFQTFVTAWESLKAGYDANLGEGLAILSEEFSSPTLARLKKEFSQAYPKARWVAFEPVSNESIHAGIALATGSSLQPVYHLDKADVVLACDSDFLQSESNAVRQAGEFAKKRRVTSEQDSMNRLYVAESGFSVTGAMADHRIKMQSGQIAAFVAALAIEINKQGVSVAGIEGIRSAGFSFDKNQLKAVANDLITNRGRSLILAGRRQSPLVHALVCALNEALGNVGHSVDYYSFADAESSRLDDMVALTKDMRDGLVKGLIILGGNPVYNAPADLNFSEAIEKVEFSVHLGPREDETSKTCQWHIPESHFLEAWGDTRTVTGVYSIIQPQIEPLFNSISAIELMEVIVAGKTRSGYDLVRQTWQNILSPNLFDSAWNRVLHDGVLVRDPGAISVPVIPKRLAGALKKQPISSRTATPESLEIVFSASNSLYDGRYANNGWLMELPDPMTKLTWGNAAVMSPMTAQRLGVKNEHVISLTLNGQSIKIPVWVVPGYADYSIGLELGYGRRQAGRIGDNVGVDVYRLRTTGNLNFAIGARSEKTGKSKPLAGTQDHHGMDADKLANAGVQKRLPAIIREATIDEYRQHPEFAAEVVEHPPLVSLWEEKKYSESPQWGMAIDLNVCTGCNACTIACQSENNIPVVGMDQVKRGREMHWIRMDRYFTGNPDNPESVVQPVACQHCEMAPCEQVCPVAATTHTEDGLNSMTYNRCVGTRYCANNCPYKVRRFNFYNYTKDIPEIVQMAQNPDVTVRFRGVMEKCTFCIQRISHSKIVAKKSNQPIRDGDVSSACEQTCPTNAIVFGDITDPQSRVSRMKRQTRDYALLGEFNTKPRLTYQAKLRNPNPDLEKG